MFFLNFQFLSNILSFPKLAVSVDHYLVVMMCFNRVQVPFLLSSASLALISSTSLGSGSPPVSGRNDVRKAAMKAAHPNRIGGSFSSTSSDNVPIVVANMPPIRASIEPAPTPAFL